MPEMFTCHGRSNCHGKIEALHSGSNDGDATFVMTVVGFDTFVIVVVGFDTLVMLIGCFDTFLSYA